MRRWFFLAASLIVSGVFLWLALRGVPLAEVVTGIREADFGWVVLSLLTVVAALAARAVRWRGLLDNRIPLVQAFHVFNIAMLLNQLPLRAGEVARSLLATRSGIPVVTAATSIVVERLLDVVTVVVMIAFALSRLPSAPPAVAQAAEFFGIAAVIAFVVMIAFARYPQVADRLLIRIEGWIPALKRLNLRRRVVEVLDGLRPLTHGSRAAHAVGWTVISWAFSLGSFYTLERALSIQGVDLVMGAVLCAALASFSIAIPVSVASIGPFEGAVRVGGDIIGINPITATTFGFLIHGVSVLCYAFFGVIGLIVLGVSLSDMLKQAADSPSSVSP